jgi:hypothetical protein
MMRQKANAELIALSDYLLMRMRQKVPVRTGRLRESIAYTNDLATLTSTFVIGEGYGVYVEFGTRFMRPQPYIRQSLIEASAHWQFGVVNINLIPPAQKSEPLRATTSGFIMPKRQLLTERQKAHVRKYLIPVSRNYAAKFKRRGIKYGVSGP